MSVIMKCDLVRSWDRYGIVNIFWDKINFSRSSVLNLVPNYLGFPTVRWSLNVRVQ